MISSRVTLALAIALLLSFAANVFLLWQWAQAKPECAAKTLSGDVRAMRGAQDRDDKRDETSAASAHAADARGAQAAAQADSATNTDKKDIRDAYRDHKPGPAADPRPAGCLRLGAVPPGVQNAIEGAVRRSNAAAAPGELQATGDAADPARPGR